MWLFRRKQRDTKLTDKTRTTDPVVSAMKQRTHKAAKEAAESSERLNKIFIQNGITLTIIRMVGGGRHGR